MVPPRPGVCSAQYVPAGPARTTSPVTVELHQVAVGGFAGVVTRLLHTVLHLVPVRVHLEHYNAEMSSQSGHAPPSSGGTDSEGHKDKKTRNVGAGNGSQASNSQQGSQSREVNSADTPPPSPAGSSERGSKACCFCWCCCCSCSCLTVRNGEENKAQSKDTKLEHLTEKEEISNTTPEPTLEEICTWSESFDRLMTSLSGKKLFREFLRSEYSEENMLFYLACEDLKKESNPELVEEKARLIYEDYISILSPKEVSLDSRVREVINRNMLDPTPRTFDEAQLQIYTLMHRDSYPRFLNSQTYKRLLQ